MADIRYIGSLKNRYRYQQNIGIGIGIGPITVQQIVSKETFALKEIDLKPLIDNIDKEEELCEELTSAFSEFQIMKRNYPTHSKTVDDSFWLKL